MKDNWAIALIMGSAGAWFFPQWEGLLFDPVSISTGDGRIIAAILFVGGLLLWYLPDKSSEKH
jgi:hypothetical protein